jgi:hypothetical protein
MRYMQGHAPVLAEGFGEQRGFSIAASGKAFKGLIDGLYSRKIEAGVRELSTNAFDAHIAAGTLIPFEVHLPSTFKPTFWIRDFGTGMSHELVMHRYTTLFESTKDGSNDEDQQQVAADKQVGMLGLGSKSFFAYTDACTLTIWMDGEVRLYSIFMGADGVPQIALAHRAPSDEPTGVKVEFAVKSKDIPAFQTAAIRVYKGFPIQPAGLPQAVKDAIAIAPVEIGDFWKAFPEDYLPDGGFYARQGCVLYPIDLVQMDENAVEEDVQRYNKVLREWETVKEVRLSERFARFKDIKLTIVMDFPIGSLEFDLSRERLAYTDHTLRNLRGRWDEFRGTLDRTFESTFAPLKTGFERLGAARADLFKGLGALFSNSTYFLDAQGVEAAISNGLPRSRADRNCEHFPFFSCVRSLHDGATEPFVVYAADQIHAPKPGVIHEAMFVFRDEAKPKSVNKRVFHHMVNAGKRVAFIFDEGMLSLRTYRAMGCPPITRLSAMPMPPRPQYLGAASNISPFERFKLIHDKLDKYDGAGTAEDVEDHLFAFINRGLLIRPDWVDEKVHPDNLTLDEVMATHRVLKALTGKSISLINVRKNEFGKAQERWGDVPLFYGCLEGVVDNLTSTQVRHFVNVLNKWRFTQSRYNNALTEWKQHRPKGSKDPILDLQRFNDRDKKVPKEDRELYLPLIFNTAFADITNAIIEVAKKSGLEVLPPMGTAGAPYGDGTPISLLPRKWETVIDALLQSARMKKFTYQLLKDYASC